MEVYIGALLPETTSWLDIQREMLTLWSACVQGGQWRAGGELRFGEFGGLSVRMESIVPPKRAKRDRWSGR